MKPKVWLFIVLAAGALLLAGCRFQVITRIEPDGSGEMRAEVGFTAEERERLESQSEGSGAQGFCSPPSSQAQASPDVTVTEERRGDETWCVTTSRFDSLGELRQLYEDERGIRINRLEIADGKFYYDIDVDTSSQTSDFSAFTAITWTVSLPGVPIYHNAAQVEGNTLTWQLAPQGGMANLRAESQAEAAGRVSPVVIGGVLLGLCAFAVIAGGGVFFLLRRSRKQPAPAAAR